MPQQFGFYSHVSLEVIPHYIPRHLFQEFEWSDGGDLYVNIVNDFYQPFRGAGSAFWDSIDFARKCLFGAKNGPGTRPLSNIKEFGDAVTTARAFLWTGDKVAMSFAPLEAMACGCPVIVPDNMDWRKMFSDEHDVLLYAEGDLDSLRSVLSKYQSDRQLREKLSMAGRKAIQKRFAAEQFRIKWGRAIEGALAKY